MRTAEAEIINRFFLDSLRSAVPSPQVRAARASYDAFCEYCFTDSETFEPIQQSWHHRQWSQDADENNRLIYWFPIAHGKSTQTKMKLCWLLGKFPAHQYAYVGASEDAAKKLVGAVRGEIESNERLREVFPDLRPQLRLGSTQRTEWGETSIRVHGCPRGTKDPSLIAYGINGKILGSRLHGIILDNVLDSSNTMNERQRQKIADIVRDEVLGRVYKGVPGVTQGGFIWILDTAWFHDDYLHVFAKQKAWKSVRLDAEDGGGHGDTLWPGKYPRSVLDAARAEMGQTAYDRQFRNRAIADSQQWFKREFWDSCYGRCQWFDRWPVDDDGDAIHGQIELRTGVDLATRKGESHDLTVFASVVGRGAQRQLVNLQSERMEGTEILRRMVHVYRTLHAPVNAAGGDARFVVEDNAAQVYIVQMMRDAVSLRSLGLTDSEASDIRVTGRTTTVKRRDMELGIPGIASGIEMGRWDFAMHEEVDQLREEMRVWSPEASHYGDRLMALWMAASDLRNDDGRDTVIFL